MKTQTLKNKLKARGFVLHETREIVVIATMFSENEKTGNMVQIWHLVKQVNPAEAIAKRLDARICFDCPHRGDGHGNRTCYVEMKAPFSVWTAWNRGAYPKLEESEYPEVFSGRKIRFGAYGESVLLPIEKMRAIASVASGWTGYTHQWRVPENQQYRAYVMASCDSPADYELARAMGWRAFRIRTSAQELMPCEIACPASDEAGKRTQCVKCALCDGARGTDDARKNIAIIVHGARSKNFVSIGSIGGAR